MELPAAYLRGVQDVTREVLSARPDAPVVAEAEPVARTPWLRASLANALYRASCAVAPAGHRPA
ncbi:hypothetical protein AMIS_10310 [Actinoplanes missouriensis 431]|uniref:Uncharacterized protein n=1 Tax=Actinoplanes missouriensis (strain ATCC 14538 / DSM 43046 / CBS 188.64 / JCM 3121 / NBRC 102363 / NCIMB 12654 / NRRL B-3342 / UNCC 431) TaxID=512565 RepID=I0GZR4_ACTM4|nr:hypothetical protein [Actinoplanes missouriensis]BAL86251.1 hypothetical protein AMIS_10310 [Actinoplanes missouriensis 431]